MRNLDIIPGMDIRRYRDGKLQVRGNARRPFRHVRRIQKLANSATVHYSLLPIHYSDDTATVYYNYRHYEPVMGRWLRRDPIGESSWVNYDGFCVNAPLVKFDILGLDVGCDDVDHFWQMLLYAVIFQSQHYSVQNTGRVYKDAVNTLKERFVWEVPVSCSELPQGKVLINEQVRFGGYLFKNFLSDQWGPFTYGFYTLGNAHVVGSLSYSSVPIGDVRIFDQCACCFNTRITLNVLISDRFDFVPDRKFWEADTLKNKLSELVYDGLALPWWLGYNIYLGASRPTVEINISETWEEILCAKK